MGASLNLVQGQFAQSSKKEKRVFPRLALNHLLFRFEGVEKQTFEVIDISNTGVQIELKFGELDLKKLSLIHI